MSTAGAVHLARSANWLAYRFDSGENLPAAIPERLEQHGTLIETAVMHMDNCKLAAFLNWLEDALEGDDDAGK